MWQRARSDQQIEERANAILKAASALLKTKALDEVTLSLIAKEACFTRSNVYKYFLTREDIFLELLVKDIRAWRKDIEKSFQSEPADLKQFAEKWVEVQLSHMRMLRLQSVMHTLLEPNCSSENLVSFKVSLRDEYGLLVAMLTRIFPGLRRSKAAEFLYAQMTLTRGASLAKPPSKKHLKAMSEAKLSTELDYYKKVLVNSIEYLLRGALDASKSP